MDRQLHLNLFINSRGHHEASWRHEGSSPLALTDVKYYVGCAQKAEAAKFDSIFLADLLAVPDDVDRAARCWLEPVTTLGALAMVTSQIGLIATASTTYTEPFNLARQLASLDHVSGGRIGWNIVTSFMPAAGRNFGNTGRPTHRERYQRAEEFVQIAKALWDSWDDAAVIDDRKAGRYASKDRIKAINHTGTYYSVAGPLNLPRCPQGRPVLVQAGSSDDGISFAAKHAEAVFTAHLEKETAQHFYKDLKQRSGAMGRAAHEIIVMPGLSPIIGGTESEAQRIARELDDLCDHDVGRKRLSDHFGGHDFSHLPLDRPLRPEEFPDPARNEAARSRSELIVSAVRRERLTLRQLLNKLSQARGHFAFAGTPEQLADLMVDWVDDHAADGFNLMPPLLPAMLDTFIAEVIPILRRRGRVRSEYRGTTLREHYGLRRPGLQLGCTMPA
ncbi:MAG: LLM class flavin-dependent oxidoreductase [Hyphomicrobiaceae bacterium]|nr:LLM class flavin-dependent oxidoreductase [Hyphomicrobiaceae bacterium]